MNNDLKTLSKTVNCAFIEWKRKYVYYQTYDGHNHKVLKKNVKAISGNTFLIKKLKTKAKCKITII